MVGLKSQHHIYFVPHRTIACEQVLEDEGVLSRAYIGEYHSGFQPLYLFCILQIPTYVIPKLKFIQFAQLFIFLVLFFVGFLPLDSDLLSIEIETLYKEVSFK